MQTCLKQALQQEESTLVKLQNTAKTWAQKVDEHWQQAQASQKLSSSDTQWQTYRDQECTRQDAISHRGQPPGCRTL